mgnify:CR=1 FL=1
MSVQKQERRGPEADALAFTGAEGETVMDTTNKRMAVHDGSREGGFPMPNFRDIQNQVFIFNSAGGTATALTVSTAVNPDALSAGMKVSVKMTAAATGAATLAWGTLTATNIKLLAAGVKSDVGADEWSIGDYVDFIYDGVDFIALIAGGGGGGGMLQYDVITATGTWVKPLGASKFMTTVVGGGGGAGQASSDAGSPGSGSSGGTTSFGSHCQATGGSGGIRGAGGTPGAGGNGGIGSLGDLNMRGGRGGAGDVSNVVNYTRGGDGGDSSHGFGAPGGTFENVGYSAEVYGGGGGGNSDGTAVGGGGGGGGTSIKYIETGVGASETVTIGAGGNGGSAGSADAGDGSAGVIIIESYR